MFGTLLSNDLLVRRIADGSINIQPFERELAQMAHYPLSLQSMLRRVGDTWKVAHDFARDGDCVRLAANEYVVVEVSQQVTLKPGYAGSFLPASNLIEQGFGLVAGKISSPFGANGERIRFGLKNYLDQPNDLSKAAGIAYLQIFDLSGLPMSEYVLTRRDIDVYNSRRKARADDDSVYSTADKDPEINF